MSVLELTALLVWGGFTIVWASIAGYLAHKGIIA